MSAVGDEVHPTLRECLGLHELLRRLGYPPDNIWLRIWETSLFVGVGEPGKDRLFEVRGGEVPADVLADIEGLWQRACELFNADADFAQRAWEGSKAHRHGLQVALALQKEGVRFPITQN